MNRFKNLMVVTAVVFFHLHCSAQNFSNELILQNLADLEKNHVLRDAEKLQLLYDWKKKSEEFHLPEDSVYARLLHKLGVLEFSVNRNYNTAISFTLKALQINTSGTNLASSLFAVTDYYNLAYYYDKMNLSKKALLYYDSTIRISLNTQDIEHVIPDSRVNKAYIFFRMGDYEKAVEESDLGVASALEKKDSLDYLFFLTQRAQALFFQNKLQSALTDVRIAIPLAQYLKQAFDLAGAWKTKGFIYAKARAFSLAEAAFRTCISRRIKTKQFWQVSSDYNDLGNFFSDSLKSYRQAADCFSLAIQYARKEGDSTRMARASLNLGNSYFSQNDLARTTQFYLQAMRYLKISKGSGILGNPSIEEITPIGNKELIQLLFNYKTELLLRLYKEKHDHQWLKACLQTALFNDSLIAEIRHEQMGEQSKLYWRETTRGFFSNALEASFLANDHNLAFFFMEKSRSVLLQDKLNELGASAFLPKEETARLENLQIRIIELQQKISSFPDTSSQYLTLRIRLLQAKENLEHHIKTLEQSYPAYFQYKYADNVKSLSYLQNYLGKRGQRFIEYFIQDTTSFAICVEQGSSSLIRIANNRGNIAQLLNDFINYCSDVNALNKNFPLFLVSANKLYHLMFSPFRLSRGRVIVCQDNYLVPFEAFTPDSGKADFLINDYAFSYVYSAQYLMNQFEHLAGKGDFLGIAPVHFRSGGGLPDLEQSDNALRNCSVLYNQPMLLLYNDANRSNFMELVSQYSTATILTHARADSLDNEPLLYMSDSVIHLSELQMLKRPATKLIVLSACQTNAGRRLNGEGIYSLARGFSSAGIPSVAATQWVADDQAVYAISEKFNQLIASGMNKDEALQQAKLHYLIQGKKTNILPYYWADLLLIGNSDPIEFSRRSTWNWQGPVIICSLTLILLLFYLRWKSADLQKW